MNSHSTIPSTLQKTAARLFPNSAEQGQFIEAIMTGGRRKRTLLWRDRNCSHELTFPTDELSERYSQLARLLPKISLIDEDVTPGSEPLHDSGGFYVLDLSSVLAASVLMAVSPKPNRILDLCAAPGGKSVFAHTLFPKAELVSNEVIGKRLAPLIANLKRCRVKPVTVTCLDPARLAQHAPAAFDLCIVDAPCSGQSLPAENKKWSGAFHESTVNMNANRQRRILAHAAELVAPGGFLAYTTCTFSKKENEGNCEWFLRRFPEFKSIEVPELAEWQAPYSELSCYRFWPHRGDGRGGFGVLFQNKLPEEMQQTHLDLPTVWRQE